jgi:hypothetical protein
MLCVYGGEGVNATPRPLFTPGKGPVPMVWEAGWAPGPVWRGAENFAPTRIQSLDSPARSRSLYRLSYPAHKNKNIAANTKNVCYILKEAWIVQSVLRLVTGWTVQGSNPGVRRNFLHPVQTGYGSHSAYNTKGTRSFPGVKRSGRCVDHPPPSSAEVKERVELYLYSPFWNFLACYRVEFIYSMWQQVSALKGLLQASGTKRIKKLYKIPF